MSENDPVGRLLKLAGSRGDVSPEWEGRARAALREVWRDDRRRRARRRAAVGAAWVGLAAGIGALAIGRLWPRPPAPPAPEVARIEAINGASAQRVGTGLRPGEAVTTLAERLALRLVTGAGLRLDRASRLRLVSAATVELEQGAVYVVSEEARGGPVEVRTPLGIVRDIGTRFEVRLAGGGLRVRVRQGRVRLSVGTERHHAGAGEELVAPPGGTPIRRPVAAFGRDWDWTLAVAPSFRTEGSTLADFLAWFSAETGRPVLFRDEGLQREAGRIRLHGGTVDLAPDAALEVMLPAAGVAYRISEHSLELTRERRP